MLPVDKPTNKLTNKVTDTDENINFLAEVLSKILQYLPILFVIRLI